MADYHTVYKGPEGETTQWEDIQRRLGNLPEKPPTWKPEAWRPEAEASKGEDKIKGKDADELSDLEDEFVDDRFMEEYRWAGAHALAGAVCGCMRACAHACMHARACVCGGRLAP